MATEQKEETVTFEGKLEKIFQTPKVLKFALGERLFVAFDSKHISLLKDYMVTDREGTNCKVIIPIPVTKSNDKKTNAEQIVLTNHTRIFLDEQLIFFPAEQQEEIEDLARTEAEVNALVEDHLKEQAVIANQQALPKQINKSEIIKKGGFYYAGGKKVPDAPRIEAEINALVEKSGRIFNLIILECDKNSEKAWARVRVQDALTKQFKDDEVIHYYDTVRDAFLLDLLLAFEEKKKDKQGNLICPINPISSFSDKNEPILTAEAKKSIIIRLLKFKQFAERDAITKAASRAYLKMLNREFRSKEEIEQEQLEVEIVNSTK